MEEGSTRKLNGGSSLKSLVKDLTISSLHRIVRNKMVCVSA